jgi:hypothetical protein
MIAEVRPMPQIGMCGTFDVEADNKLLRFSQPSTSATGR